jgi:hypothetical protein
MNVSDAIKPAKQSISNEIITKLVKAGYLDRAQCNDADAITSAIAGMRQDLRVGSSLEVRPVKLRESD